MKRVLMKFVAVLLTIVFLLPTWVFAESQDEVLKQNDVDRVCEDLTAEITCPTDIFNVHATPGRDYDGYIFRLVEGVTIPCGEHKNIRVIFAPKNIYHAATLQDIMDFVASELIMYIEPDYLIFLDPMPLDQHILPTFVPHAFTSVNDPRYRDQWCLEFIRGAATWSTIPAISTSGVVVAVIDSGIYRYHEDFNALNILRGRNFVHNEDSDDPLDDYGHGTAVTGIIAAIRNNGLGVASMACGVTILPLRVLHGNPGRGAISSIVSAIDYAVGHDVHVINMSLGASAQDLNMDSITSLTDAVNYAASKNIWMIAAVGNDWNATINYPAGLAHVIGVGAISRDGVRAGFSNFNTSVFVTAPGEDLILLSPTGTGYIEDSGTSFAAPKITALAAYARAHNPNMTNLQFRDLLVRSSINRGDANWDREYGHGIIDAGLFMYNLTMRIHG